MLSTARYCVHRKSVPFFPSMSCEASQIVKLLRITCNSIHISTPAGLPFSSPRKSQRTTLILKQVEWRRNVEKYVFLAQLLVKARVSKTQGSGFRLSAQNCHHPYARSIQHFSIHSTLYQKCHQNHIHHIYQTNLTSLHTLAKAEQNQFAFRLVQSPQLTTLHPKIHRTYQPIIILGGHIQILII